MSFVTTSHYIVTTLYKCNTGIVNIRTTAAWNTSLLLSRNRQLSNAVTSSHCHYHYTGFVIVSNVDSWQLAAAGGCGWKHREHKGNAKVESSVNFVNLVMPQKSYWTINTEPIILIYRNHFYPLLKSISAFILWPSPFPTPNNSWKSTSARTILYLAEFT